MPVSLHCPLQRAAKDLISFRASVNFFPGQESFAAAHCGFSSRSVLFGMSSAKMAEESHQKWGRFAEALLWALGHELLWALGMLQGHPALCSVVATKPEPNAAEQIFCAGKSQNVNSRAQIALEKTHLGLLLQPFQLVAATSFSPRILSLGQRSSAHSHYYLWLLRVGSRGWQRQHQWAVGKSKLFLVGKAWFWKQKSCRKHLLSYFSPLSKPEIFIVCILEVKNFQFRWKIVDVFRTCPKGGRCSPFFFTYDLSGQAVELHGTAGSLQSLG